MMKKIIIMLFLVGCGDCPGDSCEEDDMDFSIDSYVDTGNDLGTDSETASESESSTNADADIDTDTDTDTDTDVSDGGFPDASIVDSGADTDTDVDTDTDIDTDTDTDTDTKIPRPHWVLWDSNDKPVNALVFPYADYEERFGVDAHGPCMRLSYMDNDLINMYYDLSTGRAEDCDDIYKNRDNWHDYSSAIYFDSQCTGQTYYHRREDDIIRVDNILYYTGGNPDVINPPSYYYWDSSNCIENDNVGNFDFWAFKPVPDWVLNILPDAPYILTLEYN